MGRLNSLTPASSYSRGFTNLILSYSVTESQRSFLQGSIQSVPAGGRLLFAVNTVYNIPVLRYKNKL